MSLQKLPKDVQSILSASSQINTFKKAVEELVYNAIDAESTSIAIRVNIQDNTIQVIDNGTGIQKCDFEALGRQNMTSKITDLSMLKNVPTTYGCRGDALANIVTVSKIVKIISRYKETEVTCVKTYYNGKEQTIAEVLTRPSKGTTVEIKGFLYNLEIQRKSINNFNELQNIKQFLEHISIIHNNISLSLRDDSENEIVFKIHKNRDIYQTLSSLFGLKENDVQELQVEKNDYKVRAFIGKVNKEFNSDWIYINRKFINNRKLHKIVNDNFNNLLLNNNRAQGRLKSKNQNDENRLFQQKVPFYFIFISCPYIDYYVNSAQKQSVLEFKNWEYIEKLLEKLVKFYIGDVNIKRISKSNYQSVPKLQELNKTNEDTRHQIKKIMDKILGVGDMQNLGVSQLQNGIKGKLVKRKIRKKKERKRHTKDNNATKENEKLQKKTNREKHKDAKLEEKLPANEIEKTKTDLKQELLKKGKIINKISYISKNVRKKDSRNKCQLNLKDSSLDIQNDNKINNSKCIDKSHKISYKHKRKVIENITDYTKKLEKDADSIEKRSKKVAYKAERLLRKLNNRAICDSSLRLNQRHNKHVIDRLPLSPNLNRNIIDKYIWMKLRQKPFKTTYDLVKSVFESQRELVFPEKKTIGYNENPYTVRNWDSKFTSNYLYNLGTIADMGSRLSFESHYYHINKGLQSNNIETELALNKNRNLRFISNQSRDNFVMSKDKLKYKHQRKLRSEVNKNNISYNVRYKRTIEESVYTIEYSEAILNEEDNTRKTNMQTLNKFNNYKTPNYSETNYVHENNINYQELIPVVGNTYTISKTDLTNDLYSLSRHNTQNITNKRFETFNCSKYNTFIPTLNPEPENSEPQRNLNVIFISGSLKSSTNLTCVQNIEPLDICETILNNSTDKNKTEYSFKVNRQNNSLFQSVQENPCNKDVSVKMTESISYHFNNTVPNNLYQTGMVEIIDEGQAKTSNLQPNQEHRENMDIFNKTWQGTDKNAFSSNNKLESDKILSNNFNFKERLRFLPKGMSPIFALCNSKSACDYNLDRDYFEKIIYDHFTNDVKVNTLTYESTVQNVKDFLTSNIQKVNDKLNKENASLRFDGKSLKDAKVLGQIDDKFIAVIMREKHEQIESNEYLVLLDQHAVHERIRLEKNLADYLISDQWKGMRLGNVTLNISQDKILYLHNYKDKFMQLGLDITILTDREIAVNTIPEAILGKNPRDVDKVIIAVKKLIEEEINVIKLQKGCFSLYPKTIMDLVFSEACRYAIKFGDRLTKTECEELLCSLSKCKTPFQCAHGRPVMAVLVDVETTKPKYNINLNKVKQFIQKKRVTK